MSRLSLTLWLLKSHRFGVFLIVAGSLIAGAASILMAVSVGRFYELGFDIESNRLQMFGFLRALDTLPVFIGAFFGLLAIRFAATWLSRCQARYAGELLTEKLRNDTFDKQLRIDLGHYRKRGYGHYLLRWSGDLASIQSFFTEGIFQFGADLLLVLLGYAFLAALYPQAFFVCASALIAVFVVLHLINRILYKIAVNRRNARSGLLKFINSRLRAIEALKAFNKEAPESKKFYKRSGNLLQLGRAYHRLYTFVNAIAASYIYVVIGLLFIMIAITPPLERPDRGLFVSAVMIIFTTSQATRRMLHTTSIWHLGNVSFQSLKRVYDTVEQKESSNTRQLRIKDGSISLEDLQLVKATADAPSPVLINAHIERGTPAKVELHDQESVRKLTNIFLGLERPVAGKVRIDGRSVRAVDPKSLRRQVAVMSDEMPLMGANVFECISYSRHEDRKGDVAACLQELQGLAGLAEELAIEDPVSEGGWNLNPAQQSLLIVARAILTKKPILVISAPCEMSGIIYKLFHSTSEWGEYLRRITIVSMRLKPSTKSAADITTERLQHDWAMAEQHS